MSAMASSEKMASTAARRAKRVAGHRFGGTDRQLIGVLAKGGFDRRRFAAIVEGVQVPCALM